MATMVVGYAIDNEENEVIEVPDECVVQLYQAVLITPADGTKSDEQCVVWLEAASDNDEIKVPLCALRQRTNENAAITVTLSDSARLSVTGCPKGCKVHVTGNLSESPPPYGMDEMDSDDEELRARMMEGDSDDSEAETSEQKAALKRARSGDDEDDDESDDDAPPTLTPVVSTAPAKSKQQQQQQQGKKAAKGLAPVPTSASTGKPSINSAAAGAPAANAAKQQSQKPGQAVTNKAAPAGAAAAGNGAGGGASGGKKKRKKNKKSKTDGAGADA